MRKTVDEKLQSTLETRLGESFTRVVEHLERVHKGIGEMQTLAAGVGDLKDMLSNVKIRGTYGENQLGALLDQFLSVEQIVRNAWIKEGSQERVEFAVRLPGRDPEGELLLPVDSKFPLDDYERLIAAEKAHDVALRSRRPAGRSKREYDSMRRPFARNTLARRVPPISRSSFCRPKVSMPRSYDARAFSIRFSASFKSH